MPADATSYTGFINTVSLTVENILWERKKRKTKPKERTEDEKR